MTFDNIIQFRRSNRKFKADQPVPSEIVEKALEHASLAPNSSNMQLWEFHWVRDEEKKKKLVHACLNQSAARTAQELVVIVTRRDKWRHRVQWLVVSGSARNLLRLRHIISGLPSNRRPQPNAIRLSAVNTIS